MELLYPCCRGLDVHRDTAVACLIRPGTEGGRTKEIRTFGTTIGELLALAGWLAAAGCTHVAMEEHRRVVATRLQRAGGPLPAAGGQPCPH